MSILSAGSCGKERMAGASSAAGAICSKTGRRLTSDPIRTSLGLLPSGPDPVGEWLVHRQSPGPYLGPKGPESKRDGQAFAGLVWEHGKALVAVMPGLVPGIHVLFCGRKARRGWPGQARPLRASVANN